MGHVRVVRIAGPDQRRPGQRVHGLPFVPRPGPGAGDLEVIGPARSRPRGRSMSASARVTTSAIGERQMLPVQTKTMR